MDIKDAIGQGDFSSKVRAPEEGRQSAMPERDWAKRNLDELVAFASEEASGDPQVWQGWLRNFTEALVDALVNRNRSILSQAEEALIRISGQWQASLDLQAVDACPILAADGLGSIDRLIEVARLGVDKLSPVAAAANISAGTLMHRFLAAVAANPGFSNMDLIQKILPGSVERGSPETEISRAGKNLMAMGLVEKGRLGNFNSWAITPRGQFSLKLLNERKPSRRTLIIVGVSDSRLRECLQGLTAKFGDQIIIASEGSGVSLVWGNELASYGIVDPNEVDPLEVMSLDRLLTLGFETFPESLEISAISEKIYLERLTASYPRHATPAGESSYGKTCSPEQQRQRVERQLRRNWRQMRYRLLDQFGQVSAADLDSATDINDLVARIADKTHHSERYVEKQIEKESLDLRGPSAPDHGNG